MNLLLASGGSAATPVTERPIRSDVNFTTSAGVWKVKGITAFTALQDFLAGNLSKLETYAEFTSSIGVNTWRVFGMWGNTQFDVRNYPDYLGGLSAFTDWCNSQGIVPWLCLFTDQVDGSAIRLSQQEQLSLMEGVQHVVRGRPVLLECSNEDFKNGNVASMFPPEGFKDITATRSAWPEDESYLEVGSLLSFTTGHPDRGVEWVRKTQQCIEISRFGYSYHQETEFAQATGRPHVIGEPRRVAEGTTPRQHADAAAWALLSGGGYVLHGGYGPDPNHQSDLQRCNVPTGLALDCCVAAGEVFKAPLNTTVAATGRFLHGNADDGGECPVYHRDRYPGGPENPAGAVRTYCLDSGGRMDGLALDPGSEHPDMKGEAMPMRNGWSMAERMGYGGNVFITKR